VNEAEAPAFVVAENHVLDVEGYKDYARQVLGTLVPYGGTVMVRAGQSDSFEGAAPGRMVLIRFRSLAMARAWWDSTEYQAIVPLRLRAATGRVYAVQGLAETALD
jgi:uncharacterized protein (DUF1330 family)